MMGLELRSMPNGIIMMSRLVMSTKSEVRREEKAGRGEGK
jgi:hypothetical protein